MREKKSEAWVEEKSSRSEQAILGALGEFRGILVGVQKLILGMRNPFLGMASPDLRNAKTRILGATPGVIPGIDGNPHERFEFARVLGVFFKKWGGPRAAEKRGRGVASKGGKKEKGRVKTGQITSTTTDINLAKIILSKYPNLLKLRSLNSSCLFFRSE